MAAHYPSNSRTSHGERLLGARQARLGGGGPGLSCPVSQSPSAQKQIIFNHVSYFPFIYSALSFLSTLYGFSL